MHDNQAVKQGDVLFEIDPRPYQYALDRSRAALDRLEKQIGLTRRDVSAQQIGAAAAKANIGRAEAQAKQAADTLNRIEPLLAKEYVTAEQVDQARTAKRSAEVALQVARRDAERAAAAVSGVDALVAKLGELRAAVAIGEYDLEQTVVRAPFDGTVINLDIARGRVRRDRAAPLHADRHAQLVRDCELPRDGAQRDSAGDGRRGLPHGRPGQAVYRHRAFDRLWRVSRRKAAAA